MTFQHRLHLHAAAAILALGLATPALAATPYTKTDSYKNPAVKAGSTVDLTNLMGHITVMPASDGGFSLDSTIVAAAGSDADAQSLANKIKIEISPSGKDVSTVVHYPLDEYDTYYYPQGSGFVIGWSNTSTTYDGERVRINNGGFGSGANVHVDFTIHLPKGVHLRVDNKVGLIESSRVDAPQELKSGSGDIRATDDSDSFTAHTGSGDLTVSGQDGAVDLSTGSGDIEVSQQKHGSVQAKSGSGDLKLSSLGGIVTAETGSGDVIIKQFSGSGVDVRTGSGDVTIDDAKGSLKARAGSGDIKVTDFTAGDAVDAHTGSGSIGIDGDLGAVVRLSADSGSGDIVIHTSKVPSLHIEATSDSGDVDVDLPGMQNVSARPHSVRADVNGAKGSADLEAGSGDVTFTKH